MNALTEELKAFAIEEGADLVGVAPVSRWEHAPIELSPLGIWPESKSVISIAVNLTDAGTELSDEEDPQKASLGAATGIAWCMLDHLSYRISKFLMSKGYGAIPIVCTSLWRYRPYKHFDNDNSFLPDISHIHAGAACGLGEIGYSGLLITPEFGPRVRLATIITDAPLRPDPLYNGPALCNQCMKCVKQCVENCGKALKKEVDGVCEVKIEDKVYRYAKINKWRCAWGEHFSLDLKEVPPPEKVTVESVIEAMEHNDVKGWLNGRCQMHCLPPHLRYKDDGYCKPWRRKRKFVQANSYENDHRDVVSEINRIAIKKGSDLLRIMSAEDCRVRLGIELKAYLPDGCSLVVFGVENIRKPDFEEESTDMGYARLDYPKMEEMRRKLEETYRASDVAQQRVVFVGYPLTRYLEGVGYSVLTCIQQLGIFGDKLKQYLGDDYKDYRFGVILTSAALPSSKEEAKESVKPAVSKSPSDLKFLLKSLAIEKGADLMGVTSVERMNDVAAQLEEIIQPGEKPYFIVQDVGRLAKGPFVPKVIARDIEIKKPSDYLRSARSVIVLGMHFPDAPLDTAGQNPAEVVGPYGFTQSETISQLDDVALDLVKFLKQQGYTSTYSYDLTGQAGLITGSCASGRSYYGMPWRGAGMYPDMTANNFAAVAAGLGEFGWSGAVLTPEFGPRQRFTAIITDAPLKQDPLYSGPRLCALCKKCADKCVVKALSKEKKISVKIEGRVFECAVCDRLRCDWAKRYGLVGDEGPKYIGSVTDIMPPKGDISQAAFSAALKQMDPLQKACMVIVEKCIKECHAVDNRQRRS